MTVYNAQGTTIARQNDDSPQTYDAISQVIAIGSVGKERSLRDVTNLSSTLREYKKNLPDGVALDVRIQYDPGNAIHALLRDDIDSDVARSFQVTLTNSPAETWTFDGLVTGTILPDLEVDGDLLMALSIKPTGSMVVA